MNRFHWLSFCLCAFSVGEVALSFAQPPWWQQRGVFKPGTTADDFAAINQGQFKNFARAAYLEFSEKLPGGAGAGLAGIVDSWDMPNPDRDDFTVLTHGQVKTLADVFFARLEAVRSQVAPNWIAVKAPWVDPAPGTPPPDHSAVANIGQVKQVFGLLEGDRSHHSLIGTAGIDPASAGFRFGLGWLGDSDGDGTKDFEEINLGTGVMDGGNGGENPEIWLRVLTPQQAY